MSKLSIKVIPGSSRNMLKQEGESIKVHLTAPPIDGKANEALVKFLAKHYNVSKSRVEIIKGHKSRDKVVKIES